jgi:hypothetical protein
MGSDPRIRVRSRGQNGSEWNHAKGFLEPVAALRFEGKTDIQVARIWAELDAQAQQLDL